MDFFKLDLIRHIFLFRLNAQSKEASWFLLLEDFDISFVPPADEALRLPLGTGPEVPQEC